MISNKDVFKWRINSHYIRKFIAGLIAVKLSTSFATQIAVDIATMPDSPLNLFSCTIMPNNNLPQPRHITGSEAKYVVDGLRPGVNHTVKCTASFNGIESCESVSNSLGMKDIFVYAQCIMYI